MTCIARADWTSTMQEFTNRNASRRTVLEVDDPSLGLHEQEVEYELRGVAYDPRDDRVEIMLGPLAGTEGHLTHTIAAPRSVEILTSEAGRDVAIRIAKSRGATLLALL